MYVSALFSPRACVQCPDEPPQCGRCPDGQVCTLSVQTCDKCAKPTCIAPPDQTSTASNAGSIAGGVVGGLVGVGLLLGIVVWYKFRNRRKRQAAEAERRRKLSRSRSPDIEPTDDMYPSKAPSITTTVNGSQAAGSNVVPILVMPPAPHSLHSPLVISNFDSEDGFDVRDSRDHFYRNTRQSPFRSRLGSRRSSQYWSQNHPRSYPRRSQESKRDRGYQQQPHLDPLQNETGVQRSSLWSQQASVHTVHSTQTFHRHYTPESRFTSTSESLDSVRTAPESFESNTSGLGQLLNGIELEDTVDARSNAGASVVNITIDPVSPNKEVMEDFPEEAYLYHSRGLDNDSSSRLPHVSMSNS